jgi:hypothetical protein
MHPNHKFGIATAMLLAMSVYFFATGHNNASVMVEDPFDNDWQAHSAPPRKVHWSP